MKTLVFAAVALCISATAFAQFTAVSYSFTTGVDSIADGSWSTDVKLDGLASNGFGLWTASALSSGASKNFLLSNKLVAGSSTEAQSGVIARHSFTYGDPPSSSDVVKVATNLKGSTRYVYFHRGTTTDEIWVEGYDASTTNLTVGVNNRFQGLPGAGASAVVKDLTPTMNAKLTITTGHHLVNGAEDPHERFDIAMDASYLYIVWEEYNAGGSPQKTIWGAALQLSSQGSYAYGPAQISTGAGVLPTVATNVRASGSVRFDAAWLTAESSGSVKWRQYFGGVLGPEVSIPTLFGIPGGTTSNWSNPQHARILVASCASYGTSNMNTQDRGIYVIADANGLGLFYNNIVSAAVATQCDYCDGYYVTSATSDGSIGARPPLANGFDVVNHYLVAFANPYDGNSAGAGTYNEFHCMYQLDRNAVDILGPNQPLLIIPKSDYTSRVCLTGKGTANQFLYDPTVYSGAANQMGIHPLWRNNTSNKLYYRRDTRKLDENIEENTLVTHNVAVADGRSHGGSLTPTVLANQTLAIFADPVGVAGAFPAYTGQGLVVIGRGSTSADILHLNIGDGSNTGARLVVVGNGAVQFSGSTSDANISLLSVAADNFLDWYAASSGNSNTGIFGAGQSVFAGSGYSLSSNRASGQYVATITHPATLTIGASASLNFDISSDNFSNLSTTDAQVLYPFDHPVAAASTDTSHRVGLMVLHGLSSFTRTQFLSEDAWYDPTVINMRGGYSGQLAPVTFSNCYFKAFFNSSPGVGHVTGHAYVIGNTTDHHPQPGVPEWTITGGKAEGFSFGDDNTLQSGSVTVENFDMDNIQAYGLSIDYSTGNTSYLGTITGNYFADFDVSRNSNPTGIKISGATDDANLSKLDIESNTFVQANGTPSAAAVVAAIHLTNCAALIGYNNISGAKFAKGIYVENAGSSTKRHSLICSNTISGLTSGTGLVTSSYDGYAKLNSSTGNQKGHSAGAYDEGHVIFSTYTGNSSYGFEGTASTTVVDMTGVHHPSPDEYLDLAAFNVVKDNGYPQLSLSSSAIAYLGKQAKTMPVSWTVYGENDIEQGTQSNSLLIAGSPTVNIGNIDNNYWGGSTPNTSGITYTLTTYETSAPSIPSVSYSGGLTNLQKGGDRIASLPSYQTECARLGESGIEYDGAGSFQKSYDTLRLFVEQCYDSPRDSVNWLGVFGTLGGAATGLSGRNHEIWPEYREWLKKVLYYNLDTEYYCADLSEIWGTFQAYNSDSLSEYRALTDRLAVLRYIIECGKCPALAHDFSSVDSQFGMSIWDLQSQNRRKLWEDSLKSWGIDPSTRTMDTTLPSIDDLGLGLLRGKPSSVTGSSQQSGPALLSVAALNNPFNRDLDLTIDMGREALVTIEVFDVLGNAVPLTGMKYLLKQPGQQTISVPVQSSSGTYYLRVSTDWGDVKTIKVVKE